MNIFNSLLLLLLLFRIQQGKPVDSHYSVKSSWHVGTKQGDSSLNTASVIQGTEVIPCSRSRSASGKGSLKSTSPILCKRQEHQLQLWQGTHPSRSGTMTVPKGPLLVERENDRTTFNWNSFGLRYGRRQAVNAKEKL